MNMKEKKNQKNQKRKRGRPKGSKGKKTLLKEKEKLQNEKKEPKTKKDRTLTLQVKKPKKVKLKLNDIYDKNEKFFMIGKSTGFISRWEPGKEKIPYNEDHYVTLSKFPTEKQYYNIMYGKEPDAQIIKYQTKTIAKNVQKED